MGLKKIVGSFVRYLHGNEWTGKILEVTGLGEYKVQWNDGSVSEVPSECVVPISQAKAQALGFPVEEAK